MADWKEEIVISGIAGVFPESENVDELKELLFNKVNGVTNDSRKWKQTAFGEICGTGKLKNFDKFDAAFFGIHTKLANNMDYITKLFIERGIEAIIDAGLSPADFNGSNTAVFSGSAFSEAEMIITDTQSKKSSFSMLGISRTMQANRLSYFLNLKGPSYTTDGGWICGSNSLERAKKMIEDGTISSAIVGVTHLALTPELQLQYQGLNRLNRSVNTKSFDSYADGYNRSEACVVMLLQKASEAKRSYGTLLNVKSMQFGDHQGHILDHIGTHFKSLLLNSYEEANIDPATVEFIEANGSGIKNEDSMELNIMEEVFCSKQRKTPLKVGSIKSNVGHCQESGLFVSIVKAIIAFESGYIPPNINYTEPNDNVGALKTGKIQVITEKTPFNGEIIGISSFGTSNAFSHVILKRNNKIKIHYMDTSNNYHIPRLIVASGRNEENVRQTIEKIKAYRNDDEYITLTNDVFTKPINAHIYRSFSILSDQNKSRIDDVWNVQSTKRPVWFIFSGMGSQWQGMGSDLMNIPIFSDVINKCDSILKPRGVNIKDILTSVDGKIFDNILNSFVGIAAVQIGLVEVLKALEIIPDGIIGHSVGELGCAYADGCFTLEEMILSAYARGRASNETELIPGMMAAIGLGYQQIKDILPHDIDVACHNSAKSCTISGPVDSVNSFVTELQSKGIFAKAVNVANKAYHSRYIQSAGPTLLKYLKEVIKQPKVRSPKWISSSLPETKWNSDLAKYSSPEYHTNNLLNSVLFEESLKYIPSDAITIEIAPHGLLQAIIKGALPDTVTNISLTKKVYGGDAALFLLNAIGKLYTNGLNPKFQELYPKITFPVGRGTPSIHSLPFWDHKEQWLSLISLPSGGSTMIEELVINDTHLIENKIQGHYIVPFSFVLLKVWEAFIKMNQKTFTEEPVQFTNLLFKNDVEIHSTSTNESHLMIQKGSGKFEYSLLDEVIFSGQIEFENSNDFCVKSDHSMNKTSNHFYGCISKHEVYSVFENNGFNLGDNFKNINKVDLYKNNIKGYVHWKNDWIYFLDALLKFPMLENIDKRFNEAAVSVRQITLNPVIFEKNITSDYIQVDYNYITKEINCAGLKISNVVTLPIKLSSNYLTTMKIDDQKFVQFQHSECKNVNEFIQSSFDIIMEADKLNLNIDTGKLILCMPYHYGDPIFKECKKAIEQILESELWIDNETVSWENVKNVTKHDESGRFITVTNVNYMQDTMNILSNKKNTYIIVCSKQRIGNFKDWKVITQQKLNDDNNLTLIKRNTEIDGNCIFIKSIGDNYDLNVWRTLEKYESSQKTVCLVSNNERLEGVTTYVADVLRKYKSQKLRFLFILDSNAPDFELNKSFYIDHLSTGLIVNIYKDGGWGSYKRTTLQDVTDKSLLLQSPIPNIFSTKSNSKLTIEYLGLNFKDLVIEDDIENEFGPLEYSGFIENNKKIMGITSYKQTSTQITYDSLLSWSVPSTWSLKDATTVPLSYAMFYYVYKVILPQKQCLLEQNSVLITSGLHPIGQAAISISLYENLEVYAVVESNQQAEHLSHIFPELPCSRIIINTKNQFDVPIKMMTKGKGIDIILNFLSGKGFQVAQRVIADHGHFFHFSKSDIKSHGHLGTRQFLRDLSFSAIGSEMLLNESDENKLIVQQSLMDGLNKGIVKPFKSHVVTAPFSNDKIFGLMRTAFESTKSEKVVLRLNVDFKNTKSMDNIECGTCNFNPDFVYILVDHKLDWLDLAEWLVDRGARKLVITVKRCSMSTIACRRFDRLISRNVSIQIESESHLQTKEESLNWLYRLTSSNNLGSLFLINQNEDKILNNLRYSFEKYGEKNNMASFICISSKGERICNELKSIGIKALNISLDEEPSKPKITAKILPSLDILLQKANGIESSSFICSVKGENMTKSSWEKNEIITNFFPESLDELYRLNDKITIQPCFVEVQTRSPRFSQLKSVIPVFVIPGFKPQLTETFCKQLLSPVFEARLPENICSIDELSEILVNKLKNISNQGYVSLIGESWGGIVALKMAQILESQGTMVTVSLIEGDPEILTSWSESFLSKEIFINKLTKLYNSLYNEFTKNTREFNDEEFQSKKLCSYKVFDSIVQRVLIGIQSKLKALVESKPMFNKLQTKIFVFRFKKTNELCVINMNDYCVKAPFVHIITSTDYKHMMEDKKMVGIISGNVIYSNPPGVELSLSDKYKNFYFSS